MPKISELERQHGLILPNHNPDEEMSEEQFNNIALSKGVGVNFEAREKWLTENGNEITRENLIDSTLSTKPKGEQ